MIVEQGVDILYTKELFEGKGREYVLSDAGVEVRPAGSENPEELINEKGGEGNDKGGAKV